MNNVLENGWSTMNGQWKYLGGMFNDDWYKEFATSITTAVEKLKANDKDWEFEHDKLTEIAVSTLGEFYNEHTEMYMQTADMVADMWTAICSRATYYIDEEVGSKLDEDSEWVASFLPPEFLIWLATSYNEVLQLWVRDETEKITDKVNPQLEATQVVRNKNLGRLHNPAEHELF